MSNPAGTDSKAEYERRRAALRQAAARQERSEVRIGNLRLMVFLAAAAAAWLAFRTSLFSAWWLLLPLAGFLALLAVHDRIRSARRRYERAASFYERGITRMENRWMGNGTGGERFLDETHPYARDLDLFGRGSLFELLCTARTRAGEETLAAWLSGPAAPEEIEARQSAVAELRTRLDLREDLGVLGTDVLSGVRPAALASWGKAPPLLDSTPMRIAAAVLAAATTLALAVWLWRDKGVEIFLFLAFAEIIVTLLLRRAVSRVLEAVARPAEDLALFSQVLARLERERFKSPRLAELREALGSGGPSPSLRIARLNRLIVMQKQLYAPLAALLMWNIHMAYAIETWRRQSGPYVAHWLEVVGEMEALSSLAGYHYEHPNDPFPDILATGPCFEATGLGHPLIPEPLCVRNDVRLCRDLRVLVVSGSNMSGKSTFLRTVGINAVLALAGAPVRAMNLRISPVAVGASIQQRDSLQEGTSRFYAEITRLRQLVDITTGPLPLLFLLDELLHGTNSHDRSIGAEAVIRDLALRGAVGLLTTHDLALAHIAEALAPQAENVHFEDFIENGRLAFDYRLHPGVVRRSNALELMRSVGLKI